MDNIERLEDQIQKLNAKVDSLQDQLDSALRLVQTQIYLQIANNNLVPEALRYDAFNQAMNMANIPEYRINDEKEEQESLGSVIR